MSFNYAAERNRFDAEWEKLRKEYAQAGMAEESIEAMYQYDLQQFNADRAYARHNCPLNLSHELIGEDDEFENPFLEKHFEQFTTPYDKLGTHSRYWWLEELDDQRLIASLPRMTDEDKELLTLILIDGYTQEECAVRMHITQRAIGYRIQRVLGKFTEK